MKIEYDYKLGKRILVFEENEKDEVNSLRERLKHYLNAYAITEREEIDESVSLHLRTAAIKADLENQRFFIINDLDFNREYKNVVYISDSKVVIDRDSFYEFVNAYNMLDDEARGLRVLSNIFKVHLIEWMISNNYDPKNDAQINVNANLPQPKNDKIFIDRESEEFFEYCLNRVDKNLLNSPTFISTLFRCMWETTPAPEKEGFDIDYKIKCKTIVEFIEYWNGLPFSYKFKESFLKNISTNQIERIKSLYTDFKEI